jgi:acyl carrier protein
MKLDNFKSQIEKFVIDNFLFGDSHSLSDNTSFLEEGIIDSTGALELVAFLEDTFSISVEDDELIPENLDSIINVTNFLATKIG